MSDLRVTIRVEMDGREVELTAEDGRALARYGNPELAAAVVVADTARGVIAMLAPNLREHLRRLGEDVHDVAELLGVDAATTEAAK